MSFLVDLVGWAIPGLPGGSTKSPREGKSQSISLGLLGQVGHRHLPPAGLGGCHPEGRGAEGDPSGGSGRSGERCPSGMEDPDMDFIWSLRRHFNILARSK